MAEDNQVAERVRALLTERGLEPGDRLPPERQLAAELGIARSSLREGLRRLVDLGILDARRGSGTYLAAVDLVDLMELRLRLEPHAASLAAERRSAAQLAAMEELVTELGAAESDPALFSALDAGLHELTVEAAGSPALLVVHSALTDLLNYSRASSSPDPALRAATVDRHTRLLAAVQEKDAEAAEREMRGHLREVLGSWE
jgi:GntR family transcriptional regulator, transcriptional repressor for pyruvate dehydrogenase complex